MVLRDSIRIIAEDEQDDAYIEDTLGLKEEGDTISLKRANTFGLAYLVTWRDKDEKMKRIMDEEDMDEDEDEDEVGHELSDL